MNLSDAAALPWTWTAAVNYINGILQIWTFHADNAARTQRHNETNVELSKYRVIIGLSPTSRSRLNKKASLSQGNRAMPQLFFSV